MRWVVVLLLGSVLSGGAKAEELDERLRVSPGGRLEVDLDLGEGLRPDPGQIEVASHEADEVRVQVETSGWGESGVRVRVEHEGETVRVLGRVSGAFSWLFGGPHVRVRVKVPRSFSVDVRSTTAPIHIEDVRGSVRARTSDAPIEVLAAEGPVRLRAGTGDIRIVEATGRVDVKVGEGDIELRWIEGEVEARTGGGRIDAAHVNGRLTLRSDGGGIEVRDVSGPVEAKTERGSVFASFAGDPEGVLETRRGTVEVQMPRDSGAELDALTRRGEVEFVGGIATPPGASDDRAVGPLNGGGALLRLYTARGSIRVGGR